jgi:hypothetical protein
MVIRPTITPILPPIAGPIGGGLPWEQGGGSVPFSPTQVPGLLARVIASAGVTEAGTGVSSWVDRVAAYDFAQATDANRPSYVASWRNGKPSLDFNGTSDVLTYAFGTDALLAAGADCTLYLFGEVDALGSADNTAVDFLDGRCMHILNGGGGAAGWFDTAYRETAAPSTGAHSWGWVLDHGVAGGSRVYQDGVSLGTATVSALGLGGTCAIGRSAAGAAAWWDGDIAEILVYSGAHDAATVAAITGYGRTEYLLP